MMFPLINTQQIFVAQHRVDFRKSHDGLLGEAYQMGLDPFQGDVVLFIGRCRRRMKLLFCDSSGVWVAFKRFNAEAMKTNFRFLTEPEKTTISSAELQMFFEGSRYHIEKRIKK